MFRNAKTVFDIEDDTFDAGRVLQHNAHIIVELFAQSVLWRVSEMSRLRESHFETLYL